MRSNQQILDDIKKAAKYFNVENDPDIQGVDIRYLNAARAVMERIKLHTDDWGESGLIFAAAIIKNELEKK